MKTLWGGRPSFLLTRILVCFAGNSRGFQVARTFTSPMLRVCCMKAELPLRAACKLVRNAGLPLSNITREDSMSGLACGHCQRCRGGRNEPQSVGGKGTLTMRTRLRSISRGLRSGVLSNYVTETTWGPSDSVLQVETGESGRGVFDDPGPWRMPRAGPSGPDNTNPGAGAF